MIDETLLADPRRCPSCGSQLDDRPSVCSTCHVRLEGPAAARLWQVSLETARLLGERSHLIARLRAEAVAPPAPSAAPAPTAPAAAAPPYATPPYATPPYATPAPPSAPGVPAAGGPTGVPPARAGAAHPPEWTPRRVQNLLLALGVGLLAVAAVIFLAVSWGSLGVGGRAAVMSGVTALAAVAAHRTARRGLTATAEALSLLTVGLALLDCYGARASDLFGLQAVDGLPFAAGTAAGVALAAGAGSHVLRTRSLRVSSALLAQLALPLAAVDLADRVDHPVALLAAAATAQALAVLAVVAGWPGSQESQDARAVLLAGGSLAGLVATLLAAGAAYGEDGSLVLGTALLLVVALALAVASEGSRLPTWAPPVQSPVALQAGMRAALRATAAAVLVVAAWAPVVDAASGGWTAVGLAAVAAVLLSATTLVPADRRAAPAGVLIVAAVAPGIDAVRALLPAVAGRLQWLDATWTVTGDGPARRLLATPELGDASWLTGPGARPALTLLLVVAAALLLASVVLPAVRLLRVAAVPAVGSAGLLLPPALATSYAVGLASDLTLALLGLAGGALVARRRELGLAAAALLTGTAVLGLAVAWSLAVDAATLSVLPVASGVLLAAVAAGHGVRPLRGARVAGAAAAVSLLVAEAASVARHGGAGWPAVLSLALVLVLAAAAAAALAVSTRAPVEDPFWATVLRSLVTVAAAAAVSGAGAVTWWQGAGAGGTGLALSVAAAVLLAGSSLLGVGARFFGDIRVVAAAGAVAGLALTADDGDRQWLALLAVGVSLAVLGVREDHRWGWGAGLLLAASTWVRLALSDVTAPEAYTVPSALALLVVGLRRRHVDAAYPSWRAYGPGLSLALVPSLLRAVTDSGDLRPLLLGLAALVVLGLGVARRLQAPLLLGGGVLAVDALVQLAPYLVAAYEVVPRWVTIGLVGLLLLAAGATYEQRVRDLRRVGREVARLG